MRRSEWRAQETVCGYCRSCGGEIYMGEFCFRLNGRVFCRDCVRSAREIAGDTDVLPAPPQRKAFPSIHRTFRSYSLILAPFFPESNCWAAKSLPGAMFFA